MESFLHTGIKELIQKYPQLKTILEDYQIGCVSCSVGTCRLKDIVNIHPLSEDQKNQMMGRIAKVMGSDLEIEIPLASPPKNPLARAVKFSPPMKALVEEHWLIKRWLAVIPPVLKNLDLDNAEARKMILEGVDFIRSYADRFHHAKEEEILFEFFDKNLEILQVMYQDHVQGRSHVSAVVEGIEQEDQAKVTTHLTAYRNLLTQHIKKEDEILFPWMEKQLTVSQIGELFRKFRETDERIGDRTVHFENFIKNLESKYQI